jgi:N-acetylmuramate 1-kinase
MKTRVNQLESWISKQFGGEITLHPIQGDASFRHYYRLVHHDIPYIAVDAPPETENNEAFVAVSLILQGQGIRVPEVISYDYRNGFMLLSDLGDTLLSDVINQDNAAQWYQQTFSVLRQIGLSPIPTGFKIPAFDEQHIRKELGYFDEWCLGKLLQLKLTKTERKVLEQLYEALVSCFNQQAQVVAHRDFHSRNIMVLPSGELGLIDYQDAMVAPITYDLVSLLKDCYLKYSDSFIEQMCHDYYTLLHQDKIFEAPFASFKQDFDWVGLQRHLKVLGIFSRLKLRDNKQGYLNDTPRIIEYIKDVTPQYDQMAAFESLLYEKIIPAFKQVWQKEGIEQVA